MKLEIFDFLSKSIEHMYNHMDFITNSSSSLRKFFKDIFLNSDFYINTTSRIKSEDSIRAVSYTHLTLPTTPYV